MLPGFNHNIRYQDRVFHVQTEDNGLGQARLVTQIFIDGQLVALERGSYQDLLDLGLDDQAQTERIRTRMQDQHKAQMKALVSGDLDARIKTLFPDAATATPAAPAEPPEPSMVPDHVAKAAETLPSAPDLPPAPRAAKPEPEHPALRPPPKEPDAARQSHPDFLIELDEEMRRHTPWSPTEAQLEEGRRFVKEAETESLDLHPSQAAQTPRVPRRAPSAAGRRPGPARRTSASHSPVPRPQSAPPTPTPKTPPKPTSPPAAATPAPSAPPPARKPPASPIRRSTVPKKPSPATPPAQAGAPARPRPAAGRALPRRGAFPAAGDTVVDMGLPAALKETLKRRMEESAKRSDSQSRPPPKTPVPPPPRAPPPPQTEAPTPVDLRFRPGRSAMQGNPNDTMLEVDAAELQAQIAAQRARLKAASQGTPPAKPDEAPTSPPAPAAPPPPEDSDARRNILVVERSLDDVILGYLSSDE